MKKILLGASIYNVSGGVLIIFFLAYIAPIVNFSPLGNMLFRLFVGGTTITFGIGYFNIFLNPSASLSMLYYGTGLKYWAFFISVYCYIYYGLSLPVLIGFGVINLIFAILFTIYIFLKMYNRRTELN